MLNEHFIHDLISIIPDIFDILQPAKEDYMLGSFHFTTFRPSKNYKTLLFIRISMSNRGM